MREGQTFTAAAACASRDLGSWGFLITRAVLPHLVRDRLLHLITQVMDSKLTANLTSNLEVVQLHRYPGITKSAAATLLQKVRHRMASPSTTQGNDTWKLVN